MKKLLVFFFIEYSSEAAVIALKMNILDVSVAIGLFFLII